MKNESLKNRKIVQFQVLENKNEDHCVYVLDSKGDLWITIIENIDELPFWNPLTDVPDEVANLENPFGESERVDPNPILVNNKTQVCKHKWVSIEVQPDSRIPHYRTETCCKLCGVGYSDEA